MKTESSFENEPKIISWKNSLQSQGCTLNSITPLHLCQRPNGELLFALLKADVLAPEGHKIPPVIFIRGHACIIIPLIKNKDTLQERFLMIHQRRIGSGALCLEFPAGMLDRDVDDPSGIALKELKEETGLNISKKMLFPLSDKLLYSSPGASDEGIYYFGCILLLDNNSFQSFEGKIRGNTKENEHIIVTLKTKEEAEKGLTSIQARLGLYLFDDYCLNNKFSYSS